jgi:phosphoserine phosphatase
MTDYSFFKNDFSGTIVFMDFDECLVESHLSQEFTSKLLRGQEDSGHSELELKQLLDRYSGIYKNEFTAVIDELTTSLKWRGGALEFLMRLSYESEFQGVIVSSGLGMIARQCISNAGFSLPVLACELAFSQSEICSGAAHIMSSEGKAKVVRAIRSLYPAARTIQIGHSHGDLPMLRLGNGICIPDRDSFVVADTEHAFCDFWPLVENNEFWSGAGKLDVLTSKTIRDCM